MVASSTPRQRPARLTNHSPIGAAAERIELLRMRGSTDPAARAIALGFSQVLRRLDDLAKAMGAAA